MANKSQDPRSPFPRSPGLRSPDLRPTDPEAQGHRVRRGWLLLGLGLSALVVAGLLWSSSRSGGALSSGAEGMYLRTPVRAAQQQDLAKIGQRLWATQARALLVHMRRQDDAALKDALARVDRYFSRAGKGTQRFSEAVLGWDGQWAALSSRAAVALSKLDRLPSWMQWRWLQDKARLLVAALDKRAFQKHVQRQLDRHVFSRSGVERLVRDAVEQYQRRLARRDARLVGGLRLSSDALADGPPAAPRATARQRQLEAAYLAATREAFGPARAGAESELAHSLVQRVGSKLLIALAAYALKEGAVELGLLTAGTASALWSMGVGLAVAVLANWTLQYFLKRSGKSPRQAIERRLTAEIQTLRRCLVEGCTRTVHGEKVTITGLRTRLERYAARQAQRREKSFRQALALR